MKINADLHCHSVFSDGTLEPEILAERAAQNGVTHWALTDHDVLGGQARARKRAQELGMRYITGVEISVTWEQSAIHIVGLGIDPENPALLEGLEKLRQGRITRARKISDSLAAAGLPETYEGAMRLVSDPSQISRTHFARYLVNVGVCSDVHAVFRSYLTKGNPGYVPHRWAGLGEAVGWIRAAGGVAVVAHPGRYRLSERDEHAFLTEFILQHHGKGIEVVTGSHSLQHFQKYTQIALQFGMAASRGSDFHSETESRVALGLAKFPQLDKALTPVWDLLELAG